MKMSDVFELPSTYASVEYDCYASEESCRYASHAINQHDALVDALRDTLALVKSNAEENPDCTFSKNMYHNISNILDQEREK